VKRIDFDDDAPFAEARSKLLTAFHAAYSAELLRRSNGNLSEAARMAGIDRSNFRRLTRPHTVVGRK
jgi:two-component system response regulator HydG